MKTTVYCITGMCFLMLFSTCVSREKGATLPAEPAPSGQLFIIGGGERSDSLTLAMLELSGITEGGYIAVLPMASGISDSAYLFFLEELRYVSDAPCYKLNFKEKDLVNSMKLDSLRNARLIFICGGDQNRFMALVRDTPIESAIRDAYQKGSMIAGTSAGAAMMSSVMITGDENFSEEYESTYDKLMTGNAIYARGLGLLDSTIIDQHFVVRSRYNRLLTAMCDYRGMMGVGIDESTAILVRGKEAQVVGYSQVAVFQPTPDCDVNFQHLRMRGVQCDLLVAGDRFQLK